MATIWNKDILIYCVSQIMEALNRDRLTSKTLWVTAYDLLVATNRQTSGEGYRALQAALDRLSGTRIKTSIATNGVRIIEGFGLIDSWKIIERSPEDGRMVAIEINLSDWLYNAILGREVLSPSPATTSGCARVWSGASTSWRVSTAASKPARRSASSCCTRRAALPAPLGKR